MFSLGTISLEYIELGGIIVGVGVILVETIVLLATKRNMDTLIDHTLKLDSCTAGMEVQIDKIEELLTALERHSEDLEKHMLSIEDRTASFNQKIEMLTNHIEKVEGAIDKTDKSKKGKQNR
jgi:chromosome segregation ATPase